jgi:uncharacterized protein (UPF0218 family)
MLVADEGIKAELRKPFGKIMQTRSLVAALQKRKGTLVAVGDNSIYVLLQNGIRPDIAVFDFLCKRKEVEQPVRDRILAEYAGALKVKNDAGTITEEMAGAVESALLRKVGAIFVDGEEDLAALVVMQKAKAGTLLVYGQPNKGAVLVNMDSEVRSRAVGIMKKMSKMD